MPAARRLTALAAATATMFAIALMLAAPANASPSNTVTVINPPGLGTINTYNTLTATVTATDGTTAPVGSIQFRKSSGEVIAAAQTQRGGAIAEATASIVWYPTELKTYDFKAIFYPENPALLNSSETQAKLSVEVTPNGQNIQIEVPQVYRGMTAELIATTYPSTLQGSVAFTINGSPLSASIAVVNGKATFPFATQSLGWQDIGVNFTVLNTPNVFGVAHRWVNVIPNKGPASVSFAPPITALANTHTQMFSPVAPSGAVSAIATNGACTANGLTITANAGTGTCSLTATAPEGQGYTATISTHNLNLTPGTQTANTKSTTGPIHRGQTFELVTGDNRTNAGIGITWLVVKGQENCVISSGAHHANVKVRGTCTIGGTAKGVTGAWAPFKTSYLLTPPT